MQFSSKIVLLLTAAATGVFASPAVNARDVAACQTVQDGDFTYVGSADTAVKRRSESIEKRCDGAFKEQHASCTPGECQCLGKNGCYSCEGGRTQCQPGPDSGVCWKE